MIDLKEWCLKYNVIDRTISAFYTSFKEYEEAGNYGEILVDSNAEIIPVLDKVHFVLSIPEFNSQQVYVDLNIQYNETNIGWYRTIYDLDGTVFDDFLVIEKTHGDGSVC